LLRITPRTKDRLCYPGLPWVARAQQEHDIAAQSLRDRGVEVLYVMELLQDVMEYPTARAEAIVAVLGAQQLGERLRADLGSHLAGLDPEELARVLVTGLSREEFRAGHGVVFGLMDRHDFVIPPLPNLMFLRGLPPVDRPYGRDGQHRGAQAARGGADREPVPAPPAVRRRGLRVRPGTGAARRR